MPSRTSSSSCSSRAWSCSGTARTCGRPKSALRDAWRSKLLGRKPIAGSASAAARPAAPAAVRSATWSRRTTGPSGLTSVGDTSTQPSTAGRSRRAASPSCFIAAPRLSGRSRAPGRQSSRGAPSAIGTTSRKCWKTSTPTGWTRCRGCRCPPWSPCTSTRRTAPPRPKTSRRKSRRTGGPGPTARTLCLSTSRPWPTTLTSTGLRSSSERGVHWSPRISCRFATSCSQ
mmetsp:Transcript_61188/g.175539  ORF Transcript_61188/g.175539 Transcript_61188/m.175539 type:complete len:229 (+) Transcript_61188:1677-2363(+)